MSVYSWIFSDKKMNVPSNSEVRMIMTNMFGEHTTKDWSMDDLRHHVRTLEFKHMHHYPEHVQPLLLWLESLEQ